MSEIWRCRIKIITNPHSQSAFNMRLAPDTKQVNIKIIIKSIGGLHPLLDEIIQVLHPKYNWLVEWNWKNTPEIIKNDAKLRQKILEMFSSAKVLTMPFATPAWNFDSPEDEKIIPLHHSINELVMDTKSFRARNPPPCRETSPTILSSVAPRAISQICNVPLSPYANTSENSELDILASKVVLHVKQYRQNPELSNLTNMKKQLKAINFVKCILARQDLSNEDALIIAQKASLEIS
jgi:hypothetical protein